MTTYISPNLKKVSERIDPQGNVIDPRTKQIIQKNNQEYTPTPEELARVDTTTQPDPVPQATESPTVKATSERTLKTIKEEIAATEANLAILKIEKEQKAEEMRKELED